MKIMKAGYYKANQAWPVGFDFGCNNYDCQCVFQVEEGDNYEVQLVNNCKGVALMCPECGNTHLHKAQRVLTRADKTITH